MNKKKVLVVLGEDKGVRLYKKNPWEYLSKYFEVQIDIINISKDIPDFLKIIPSFNYYLRNLKKINNYDVIISTSAVIGLFLAVVQSLFGYIFFKPKHVVIDVGTIRVLHNANKIVRLIVRQIFSRVKIIFCYASKSVEFWKKFIGFKGKCFFIPLPVDTEYFAPIDIVGNYIVSAGRVGRDFDILLEAIKNINEKFVIICSKDDYNILSTKVGSLKNVEIFCEISVEEYKKLVQNSKFVVLPFKRLPYDTGQTVLTQCMAMGKAVIATRFYGTQDYIIDGEDGFLVEPGDLEELRNKVQYLLQNQQKVEFVEKRARQKALKEFNTGAIMIKVIEKLLKI